MFRTARAAAAFTLLLARGALAQQAAPTAPPPPDFSKVEIKTTDLGDNVYMLEGQGGNITVAVAANGIIMVDGQFAPLHDKIKAAISTISPLPIKYLINTHYHGDHTGGNEAFGKEGATIVANAKLKDRLANPPPGNNGQSPPASPAEALPKQVYTDKTTISSGGRTARTDHPGPILRAAGGAASGDPARNRAGQSCRATVYELA